MPRQIKISPSRLEDQCLYVYLNYLHDEVHMLYYLRNFETRSVLLRQYGMDSGRLSDLLHSQFNCLPGILHDSVRQKMLDILISKIHLSVVDMQQMFAVGRPPPPLYSRSDSLSSTKKVSNFAIAENQDSEGGNAAAQPWYLALAAMPVANARGGMAVGGGNNGIGGNNMGNGQQGALNVGNGVGGHGGGGTSSNSSQAKSSRSVQQYRSLPIFQLFELILHKDLKILGKVENYT